MVSEARMKKAVSIGDVITYGVGFEDFGDGMAVSRGFDDKMGVYIAVRVLEELAKAGGASGDYICAATVQEEIGLRDGTTSAYGVHPISRSRSMSRMLRIILASTDEVRQARLR